MQALESFREQIGAKLAAGRRRPPAAPGGEADRPGRASTPSSWDGNGCGWPWTKSATRCMWRSRTTSRW